MIMCYLYELWNFLKDYLILILIFVCFIIICAVIIWRHIVKEGVKRFGIWLWNLLTNLANLLLCIAGVLIAVALGFFGPDIYEIYPKLLKQMTEGSEGSEKYFGASIRYFGVIAAAGAVIGYIVAIARNIISNNQNKISEQGRIAEQISRAIDQIGAYKTASSQKSEPNIEARVGGIYSLERIAQDSDRDYAKIMNILCAYVRATALKKPKNIREDIQGAIDVLGTKTKRSNLLEEQAKFRVNLENCNLSGYSFNEGDFNRYIENGKNGAIFDKSKFEKTRFYNTDLSYASFDGAILTKTYFDATKLKGARFAGADCGGTIFKGAYVYGADFSKARNLTQNQVNKMIGDNDTLLPDDIERPEDWLTPI